MLTFKSSLKLTDNKLGRNGFRRGKAQNVTFYQEPTVVLFRAKKTGTFDHSRGNSGLESVLNNYTCSEDNILPEQMICCCICLLFA